VLKFLVFKEGQPLKEMDLRAAYLVGADEVPLRGQIKCAAGLLTCEKTTDEAVSLALMWEVKGSGNYLLQTTRLPDRDRPYILNVELARWRLMRLMQKLEDWALFDYPQMDYTTDLIDRARALFVRALQTSDAPAKAADLGDQSLELSLEAGEVLAKFHAHKMLIPRLQAGALGRKVFGCTLDRKMAPEQLPPDALASLNFVNLPVCWAELQPTRQRFNFGRLDRWFDFLLKRRVTIKLASVVRLNETHVPNWLKRGNVDFEAIRDLVYEYLSHIANRYGKYIRSWVILSGIHAENYFNLNFDQILELTRLASLRAKQLCPRAATVIEIICPWGEYYARNPRTIHPFLYADMVAQSGINFDAFALELLFGASKEGMYTRDFFQISSLIDRFAILGKALHLTTAAPSQTGLGGGTAKDYNAAGYWTNPWSAELQARWLETFYQIVLSKPLVESITWDSLSDAHDGTVQFSGLFTKDWTSKPALATMRQLQKRLAEARTTLRPEA